ncbi:MAG: transposase, partial [Acetobacteraceae bacterium]|nr:transposase [Acetobacteraceae bacterium]
MGVPAEITFKTKTEIARDQIRAAYAACLPRAPVLMDAGYGADSALRAPVAALGLPYVAGILSSATVWPPAPAPCRPRPGRRVAGGRPRFCAAMPRTSPSRSRSLPCLRPSPGAPSPGAREAMRRSDRALPGCAFARQRDFERSEPRPEEWLLIEWPKGEAEPTKYWLSSLPKDISFRRLLGLAKLRSRIERDYQELKQEIGLGHFE